MSPNDDPVLEAVTALRDVGIAVAPIGDDMECWQISDLISSDSDLLRWAESRGLVDGGADARYPCRMSDVAPLPPRQRPLAMRWGPSARSCERWAGTGAAPWKR